MIPTLLRLLALLLTAGRLRSDVALENLARFTSPMMNVACMRFPK